MEVREGNREIVWVVVGLESSTLVIFACQTLRQNDSVDGLHKAAKTRVKGLASGWVPIFGIPRALALRSWARQMRSRQRSCVSPRRSGR